MSQRELALRHPIEDDGNASLPGPLFLPLAHFGGLWGFAVGAKASREKRDRKVERSLRPGVPLSLFVACHRACAGFCWQHLDSQKDGRHSSGYLPRAREGSAIRCESQFDCFYESASSIASFSNQAFEIKHKSCCSHW